MKKIIFSFICFLGLASTAAAAGQVLTRQEQERCTPDVGRDAGLFVSPPIDIANVGSEGVTPLGQLNSAGGHIFPTDHMYIDYPADNLDHAVYAMAAGEIYMIMRQGNNDWQVSINHTCSVSSYVTHLSSLSTRIQNYLTSWYNVSSLNDIPWQAGMILMLGQDGDAPLFHVNAGEQIGNIHSDGSHSTWDVGVIDRRYQSGTFADLSPLKYPGIPDLAPLYGVQWNPYRRSLLQEKQHTHAGCFIDYFPSSGALLHDGSTKAGWTAILAGGSCGKTGWDTWDYGTNTARLQGSWFNNNYVNLNKLIIDQQNSAFTVVPNQSDNTKVNIAFGFIDNMREMRYTNILLDPSASARFFNAVAIDNVSTDQNKDPASVSKTSGTICYDLSYGNWDYVLVNMTDDYTLRVKYFPVAQGSAVCSGLSRPLATPDSTWKTYVR